MQKHMALKEFCGAIAGFSNAIGSDFKDIRAYQVESEFPHGEGGLLVQFTIRNDALGKAVHTIEASDALGVLKNEAKSA